MLNLRTGQHFGWDWTEYGDFTTENNVTLPTTSEYTLVLDAQTAISMTGQSVSGGPVMPANVADVSMTGQTVGGAAILPVVAASLTLEIGVAELMATMPANYAGVTMDGQTVNLTYIPPGGGYVPRPLWAGVWEGVWRGVQ